VKGVYILQTPEKKYFAEVEFLTYIPEDDKGRGGIPGVILQVKPVSK